MKPTALILAALFSLSALRAADLPRLEPLTITPAESKQLENSHAWKWRYRTAEVQQNLHIDFMHYTRDAEGKWKGSPLPAGFGTSSGTTTDNGKINDTLVLFSIAEGKLKYSITQSRPGEGSGSGAGEFFRVSTKDFIPLHNNEMPAKVGDHWILLARTKDGKAPVKLDDIIEFISVTHRVY